MNISQLAREAGVSARALRHYEQLGLLAPSRSRTNGYREYCQADLERVQQILSLTGLGLSLRQVGDLLGDDACPQRLVDLRLGQVEREVRELTELRDKLVRLRDSLESGRSPTPEDLLTSLEVINMFEKPESDPILLELGHELIPLVSVFGQSPAGLLHGLRRVRTHLREAGIYLPGVRVRDVEGLGASYRLVLFGREHPGGPLQLAVEGAEQREDQVEVIIRHVYQLFCEHRGQLGLLAPRANQHEEECDCLDCQWLKTRPH